MSYQIHSFNPNSYLPEDAGYLVGCELIEEHARFREAAKSHRLGFGLCRIYSTRRKQYADPESVSDYQMDTYDGGTPSALSIIWHDEPRRRYDEEAA